MLDVFQKHKKVSGLDLLYQAYSKAIALFTIIRVQMPIKFCIAFRAPRPTGFRYTHAEAFAVC